MKYAINYHKGFRYMDRIDEVMIIYKDKLSELIDFVKDMPQERRVILDIAANPQIVIEDNLETIRNVMQVHKNIALKISLAQREVCVDLYEMNIPFFFCEFADSWDTLVSFIRYRVSDVYVVNELAFEMKDVSKMCKEYGVNIRVFPNVAQTSSRINNLDKLKSFFIRPEDVEIYEPYVDIFEFFGPDDRESVLFEVYNNGKWAGDLKDLIIGLDISLHSDTIMPLFGEERVNCGKQCYKGRCIICDKVVALAKQLEEAKIKLVKTEMRKDNESEVNEIATSNETAATS